jgi:hypothetical protein
VVDRVGLAFVFLRDVIGETVHVGFEDLLRAVFQAAVHHDVFQVRVALERTLRTGWPTYWAWLWRGDDGEAGIGREGVRVRVRG